MNENPVALEKKTLPQEPVGLKVRFFDEETVLPLVVEPVDPQSKMEDQLKHLFSAKSWLLDNRAHFGGVLLRGFQFHNTDAFQRFLETIDFPMMPYVGGVGLRGEPIQSLIYKSTNFPSHLDLHVHNEATYSNNHPKCLIFYCLRPSATGGETPLADSRNVFHRVKEDIRKRFHEKGITYVRYLHKTKGKYLAGWPEVFGSKEEVERICTSKGVNFEWLHDDILRLTETLPAILPNSVTQEPCWLNQATIFHQSFWTRKMPVMERGLPEEHYPTNVSYGDGSPVDEEDIKFIEECWAAEYTAFKWQQGDVLLVDNEAVAHGRYAFEGPREIQVVLTSA